MLQQEIVIDTPKRQTRDEMNLAEFPLTLLSTRSDPKIKTLEFRDHIRGKNGDLVNREWIITGADKFGLPTASDDEVLIGLLKLSVDQGFNDRKVYFTRYELLKTLQWTTEGRSYQRLMKALDRLSGVRIKATNAFFDNSSKTHSTVNFGIIDAYEVNDGRDISGRESGSSFFLWSEVLFKSFQVGYIKKLDLTFYLALKSAVSKRMFRYLDKHFWYRSRLIMKAFTFAHEKLGISRNYKYLSSIRQQIDPALDELIEHGFLAGYTYQGRGDNAEIVITSKAGAPRVSNDTRAILKGEEGAFIKETPSKSNVVNLNDLRTKREDLQGGQGVAEALTDSNVQNIHSQAEQKPEQKPAQKSAQKRASLILALTDRGLKPKQGEKLLSDLPDPLLDKVALIIEYYDELCQAGSKLVNRSPVGFLYRAVENPVDFNLPGVGGPSDGRKRQESFGFGSGPSNTLSSKVPNKAKSNTQSASNSIEIKAQYLVERKKESKRLRLDVEPKMLAKIKAEVEVALSKFKENISEKNFTEAVEHGIEERLLALFAFPNFEEWLSKRG